MLKLSVLSWSVMATFAVIGCASVDVRGVGTGTTQASYELRGKTMAQLEVEAQRLCPRGHEVQHRWQRYSRPETEDGKVATWWNRAVKFVNPPPDDDAQLTVLCKA